MAFNIKNWWKMNAGEGFAYDGSVKSFFSYISAPDTISDVLATGYFNVVAKQIREGDIIRVSPSLTSGLNTAELVVTAVAGDVATVKTIGFLQEGATNVANLELLAFRYNTSTPPAPVLFKGDYRIIDAFIIPDVAPALSTVLDLFISGVGLCNFDVNPLTVKMRVNPAGLLFNTDVNNVNHLNTFSWSGVVPANLGEGTIYMSVVPTR